MALHQATHIDLTDANESGRRPFKSVAMAMAKFFGLPAADEEEERHRRIWRNRRARLVHRGYGGLKQPCTSQQPDDAVDGDLGLAPPPISKKPSAFSYLSEYLNVWLRRRSRRRQVSPDPSRSFSASLQTTEDNQYASFDRADQVDSSLPAGVPGGFGGSVVVAVTERVIPLSPPPPPDRRQFGVGVVGQALRHTVRSSVRHQNLVRQQLDEMEDYRPYFTYWVSTAQILILILALAWYGFAPFGVELSLRSDFILTEKLMYEQVAYYEPSNFWIGPRAADLIHLGAKFSPCMRWDQEVMQQQYKRNAYEAQNSGCCVRNDRSGCMQTTPERCSPLLSTFYKWGYLTMGPEGRTSGPVCGQDPRYCLSPASRPPYPLWPDDIEQWPICLSALNSSLTDLEDVPVFVTCRITARPCCIGIHGRCELRSEEYCRFVGGHFHSEATLCSQVSCMQDVCGMLPFLIHKDLPDQVYRHFTSLFLHAGIIHLVLTLGVQFYLMRDLERLCGPLRLAIIYFGSGIVGNVASAVFVPYRAESGPAGSQFGLLASLIVECVNAWPLLTRPCFAMVKLVAILALLLLFGFLPWVDNYAHVFGFLGGLLLSFIMLPYVSFKHHFFYSRAGRILIIAVCFALYLILLMGLLLLFYLYPVYDCQVCKYFSCIPFTDKFCAEQNIDFAIRDEFLNF